MLRNPRIWQAVLPALLFFACAVSEVCAGGTASNQPRSDGEKPLFQANLMGSTETEPRTPFGVKPSFQKSGSRFLQELEAARGAYLKSPGEQSEKDPYTTATLLADRMPSPEKPLLGAESAAATPLSGYKSPDSVKLFSRVLYLRNRLSKLAGRQFYVEGKTLDTVDIPDGYFLLYRWMIDCCANDAKPLGVMVSWDRPDRPATGDWVKINGRLENRTIDGHQIICLKAKDLERIPPPEKPYLTY